VTLNIDLEKSFHIHVFDIIDEKKARMDKDYRVLRNEHNPSSIVYGIEYEASKNIVYPYKEGWQEYIITKFMRKYQVISIKYPYQYP
jgi:hypothetical protein